MSTSIYLNSLIRFDEDKQIVSKGNVSPFEFTISQKVTGNWVFERRPFSRTAIMKMTDSFQVKVCKVMVPKIFMPIQLPVIQLQIQDSANTSINRAIGPNIKNINIYGLGATGLTGTPQSCIPCGVTGTCGTGTCCVKSYYSLGLTGLVKMCIPPSDLNNFDETWTLYPADNPETATYWMYDSCSQMAINHDWKNYTLNVRLRDQAGYIIQPFGFTGSALCDFNPCLVTARYAPLFLLENQLIIILNAKYVENDAVDLNTCCN